MNIVSIQNWSSSGVFYRQTKSSTLATVSMIHKKEDMNFTCRWVPSEEDSNSASESTKEAKTVDGIFAANMPRAFAVATRISTTDFSPSAPTTTTDCSRNLLGLGGTWQLDSAVLKVPPPLAAFILAMALT